ncbi:MAG: MFS transporter [Chloroflexota bacterium]|nr:MFS transporter [Chloroflexota bacterium]
MHILIAYLSRRLPFYYGWLVLGSAGSSMFVRNAAGSLTFAVFVPLIADDTGWSRALIGGAAAVGGLLATGASPAVGWAVDRFGARVVLVSGIIIIGLSTMAMAWLSVHIAIFYAALAIGRIMFSSPLNVGPATVVGRWFVRQRGRATGLLFLSHSGGMVAFPLVATWVSVIWGWETAWIVLGLMVYAIALLPASLLIAQRPEDVGLLPDGDDPDDPVEAVETATATEEQPADAGIEWTTREALRTPALWVLALGTGFLFLLQSGTNNYQADLLRSKGIELALSQLSIVVNAAGTGIGSLLWGRVVEQMRVSYTYAIVALVMALACGIFVIADTVWLAFIGAGLFGVAVGGILVVPPVAYANFFGRQSLGTIRGVTEPFTSLGQAIGAVASGLVFHFTGGSYAIAFIIYTALGVLTAAALLLARPPQHPSLATRAVGDPADD